MWLLQTQTAHYAWVFRPKEHCTAMVLRASTPMQLGGSRTCDSFGGWQLEPPNKEFRLKLDKVPTNHCSA
jgi:hypothetical protein